MVVCPQQQNEKKVTNLGFPVKNIFLVNEASKGLWVQKIFTGKR
jgi:hypothetical protein